MAPVETTNYALLPCKICGDVPTGLQCGVSSCAACKAFFKRSVGKSHQFRCNAGDSCVIDIRTRMRCKACRWKKCLDQGMIAEALDIAGGAPKIEASNGGPDLQSGHGLVGVPEIAAGPVEPGGSGTREDSFTPHVPDIMAGIFQRLAQRNRSSASERDRLARRSRNQDQTHLRSISDSTLSFMLNDFTRDAVPSCVVPTIRIGALTGVNRLQVDVEPSTLEKYWGVMQARNSVLEDSVRTVADAAEEVFGDTIRTDQEYYQRLHLQGLVPYQPECSLSQMNKNVKDSLIAFISALSRFASLVPGFSDLGAHDRAAVVQEHTVLTWLILHSSAYTDEDSYYPMGLNGAHYCRYWMRLTLEANFMHFVYALAAEMKKLQLTITELGLLLVVALLRRGSSDVIEDKTYLDFLYSHYLDALIHLIGPERVGILSNLRKIVARFPVVTAAAQCYLLSRAQNAPRPGDMWEFDDMAVLVQRDPDTFAPTDFRAPHF